MGPRWLLPIDFPSGPYTQPQSVTVRLTAWQYDREYSESDLRPLLAQGRTFAAALADGNPLEGQCR
jgi:hypothetical protein